MQSGFFEFVASATRRGARCPSTSGLCATVLDNQRGIDEWCEFFVRENEKKESPAHPRFDCDLFEAPIKLDQHRNRLFVRFLHAVLVRSFSSIKPSTHTCFELALESKWKDRMKNRSKAYEENEFCRVLSSSVEFCRVLNYERRRRSLIVFQDECVFWKSRNRPDWLRHFRRPNQ